MSERAQRNSKNADLQKTDGHENVGVLVEAASRVKELVTDVLKVFGNLLS